MATSYNKLRVMYRALGQYNKAEEYHEKTLNIKKKNFVEEHRDVAASYNNLGIVYKGFGQCSEAKEKHEKEMTIAKRFVESTMRRSQQFITSWAVSITLQCN